MCPPFNVGHLVAASFGTEGNSPWPDLLCEFCERLQCTALLHEKAVKELQEARAELASCRATCKEGSPGKRRLDDVAPDLSGETSSRRTVVSCLALCACHADGPEHRRERRLFRLERAEGAGDSLERLYRLVGSVVWF